MIRVLLIILSILIAILAFVLEQQWLYAAAGIPLAAALALIGSRLYRSYRSHNQRPGQRDRGDGMEDYGLFDLRPAGSSGASDKEATADGEAPDDRPRPGPQRSGPQRSTSRPTPSDVARPASPTSRTEGDDAESGSSASAPPPVAAPPPSTSKEEDAIPEPSSASSVDVDDAPVASNEEDGSDEDRQAGALSDAEASSEDETASVDAVVDQGDPVLTPLLQSLREVLDAPTACLLVQEDVIPEYRILAISSAAPDIRQEGTFATQDSLLTAQMTRRALTVRDIGSPDAVADFLGYYRTPADVDHVALAPIDRPNEPVSYFLLVDGGPDIDLGRSRPRTIIKQYAGLVSLVMDADFSQLESSGMPSIVEDTRVGGGVTTTASEAAAAEREHAREEESANRPRPRSEIIREEMEAADEDDVGLSLVLVHLNRAEAIARNGEEAVESAEYQLRTYLEDVAPGHRVTRFGELTYGVFFRGDVEDVEPWAIDVQQDLDQAPGELEGGASIGVAVRGPKHDAPESLRADATNALSEAYKTGACTIVEG